MLTKRQNPRHFVGGFVSYRSVKMMSVVRVTTMVL
nr:MAG TPA: hypothetical protein [Caudoviricetes sp.]